MQRDLERLERERFDLLIVGGGINGAGAARDAAKRGLSVALVERDDFGDGTSSRSSRLVHGGLRYLEHFRFGLVRESLRERATLLRIAPHLVRPMEFLIPLYRGSGPGPLQLRTGLFFYDHLARRGPLPQHEMIDAKEALEREPALRTEGLRGGALYPDAWVDDRRLVLLNLLDAARHGAAVANHVEVTWMSPGFEVVARDRLTDRELCIRARHVVNAAGPFADMLLRRLEGRGPEQKLLRLSQGAHLAFPPSRRDHALLLFSPVDERVVFVIPEDDVTLLGTTEEEVASAEGESAAFAREVEYLLRTGNDVLPGAGFERDAIHYAYAGLRPLVDEPGKPAGKLSREAELEEEHFGSGRFVSVLGGKITSYRALAQRLVDRFSDVSCTTHRDPLPGAEGIPPIRREDPHSEAWIDDALAKADLPSTLRPSSARHLVRRYGSTWTDVLAAADGREDLLAPLDDGPDPRPEIGAEVVYAAREEMAVRLADVLLGRLTVGRAPGNGRPVAERAAELLAEVHGYDAARRKSELEHFVALADARFVVR